MSRSLKIYIALSLIALTTMYVDCRKYNYGTAYPQHYYSHAVNITPYQLNYSIGDTVFLHVSIPDKMLYDTLIHQQVRYDSGYFSPNATVQLLYNNPFVTDGLPLVSFVYTQGVTATEQTNQTYTFSTISFGCNQLTDYEMLVGIVFNKKGVYGISLGGSLQKCFSNVYTYNQVVFNFNVADSHYSYYTQLPFTDINQQQDITVLRALNAKTQVCVNVQ